MPEAVLFDLFETLVTESHTRPAGVSSLAVEFGCERDAFRKLWKPIRPSVTAGHLSFRQALRDIATNLGGRAEDATLQRLSADRARTKSAALVDVDQVITILDHLRRRSVRLGVISRREVFSERDIVATSGCLPHLT